MSPSPPGEPRGAGAPLPCCSRDRSPPAAPSRRARPVEAAPPGERGEAGARGNAMPSASARGDAGAPGEWLPLVAAHGEAGRPRGLMLTGVRGEARALGELGAPAAAAAMLERSSVGTMGLQAGWVLHVWEGACIKDM